MRRKNKPLSVRVVCALVAASALLPVAAQTTMPSRPKLVIGIIIDGLDIDKLYSLREHFTAGGFNRLINNGVTISDLQYGSHLDNASATAVIVTGASPSVNGVSAATTYDVSQRRPMPVFLDTSTIGNFTEETYSPAALRVSTIADELRIDTSGLGIVHAISPDATTAIVLGGHSSNSACWIADKNARWASSTWYTEFPTSIQQVNHSRPLSARLDTIQWAPTLSEAAYANLPSHKKIYSFRHIFPSGDPDRISRFKVSAPVNTEVTSIACGCLKSLNMGNRQPLDMLELCYTLQPYTYSKNPDTRVESIDSYLRLDRDLERLFSAIDTNGPGMSQTLIWVAGTPTETNAATDDERWRIPTGQFTPSRAISLLKVNLMSIYGNGDWVVGYHNGQIFLNREVIQQRGLNLQEVRRETADFLRRMSGITHAATIDDVITAQPTADSPFPPARNIDIDTAGDVFLAVAPGWEIISDTPSNSGWDSGSTVRYTPASSAAFILYPDIDARVIDTPVDARIIAPTVARLLRIRSPNGAQLPPLRL